MGLAYGQGAVFVASNPQGHAVTSPKKPPDTVGTAVA